MPVAGSQTRTVRSRLPLASMGLPFTVTAHTAFTEPRWPG